MSSSERFLSASRKVAGGKLLRVRILLENSRVREAHLAGDFFLHPEEAITDLEKILVGMKLDRQSLVSALRSVYEKKGIQSVGVTPEDFAETILLAASEHA